MDARDDYGQTALIEAAVWGKVNVVEYLLDNGAKVNISDNLGTTALMRAATWADLEVVKLLVHKGADVNARCKNGRSPLVMAAWCFAQIIQRHGCGNGQNMDLYKPAAMRRSLQVVKFLLDQGAEVNPKNEMEDSPLSQAVAEGNLEVVKLLKAHGAKD